MSETVYDTDSGRYIHRENWYKKVWRPACAAVYMLICLFDFIVMPVVIEATNDRVSADHAIELALKFDNKDQLMAMNNLSEKRTWSPLTLQNGAIFHMAFGALLTGAAVTRGLEKREHASKNNMLG